MAPARAILGKSVAYAASINDCLSHAGLCVLTTSDPAFLDRDLPAFKKRRMTIIDCWRLFPRLEGINNLNYISMGSHDQNVPEHQPK